jgi:hypothetical protein
MSVALDTLDEEQDFATRIMFLTPGTETIVSRATHLQWVEISQIQMNWYFATLLCAKHADATR